MMHRQNVETLSQADAAALAAALARMQATSDNRGYTHYAGMHGWPHGLCKHHMPLFLPWHRAYLYMFELSLRDLAGDVRLPWWDWTSAASHTTGVPGVFSTEASLTAADLPLDPATLQTAKEKVPYAIDVTGPVPRTVRHADKPSNLPTPRKVAEVLSARSFADFTTRLEDIHDGVHGWFQGSMAIVPFAAFDPIFWAHHTMIDRLWYLWQLDHPGDSGLPLDRALEGFPLTVRQVMDVTKLGYDYAAQVIA